jgi:hypothetical protein
MMDKLYFIVAMVIAFYISVSSIQSFTIKYEAIDELVREYKAGYIEEMITTNNSTCPDNYISLVMNFNWPGNYKGCGCKDSETEKYSFYKGYCPNMKLCHSIEESKEIIFNKWRGQLICYKRAKTSYDKLPLVEIENIDKCNNSTHRVCGVIDGKKNFLCLDKEKKCPITKIKFLKKVDLQELNNDSKVFEINDEYSLYISREELKYENLNASTLRSNIIISFIRTDLTEPCLNPMKSPSTEIFFPLMKNKFDLECDRTDNGTEITDDSFIVLDGYKFQDYYKDNNFFPTLNKIIDPFDIEIPNNNIKIYGKTYPGWNLKCQKANPESLHSFLKISQELNAMLISIIIHSFISIGVIVAIGVFACFLSKYFELLFKAVNLGFIILNLIYPIQIISNSNWVVNILTDENGALCGDLSLNGLLVEISSASLKLQNSFILILLLAILSCIVFIYVLYAWITPATREVQENLIEMKY